MSSSEPFEKNLNESKPTGAPGESASSGPSAHHDRPLNESLDAGLVPDTSDMAVDLDVSTIRRIMLEQDAEFKRQVSELHRVVKVQKEIMRELETSLGSSCLASQLSSDSNEMKMSTDAKGSGILPHESGSSLSKMLNIPRRVIDSELPADAHVDTDHNEKTETEHELPVDTEKPSAVLKENIWPRRLMIDLNKLPEDIDMEEAENPNVSNVLNIQQHGARSMPRSGLFCYRKGEETRIEKMRQECRLFNSVIGRGKGRITDEFRPPSLPSMMPNEKCSPYNNQAYGNSRQLGISGYSATASLPCLTRFSEMNLEIENSDAFMSNEMRNREFRSQSLHFPNGIWRNSIYATGIDDTLQTYKGSAGNACRPRGISPFIDSDDDQYSMVYPPMISSSGKVAAKFEPKEEKLHVKVVGFPSMEPKRKSASLLGPVSFAKQNFCQPKFGASYFSTGLSACIEERGHKRKMNEQFEGSGSGKDSRIHQKEMCLNSGSSDVSPIHRLRILPPSRPYQLEEHEFWHFYSKSGRSAAMSLLILSTDTRIHSEDIANYPAQSRTSYNKLAWFADVVLSTEDAEDSFEALTLKLEEIKEEEYGKWLGPISGGNSSERKANAADKLLGMARRGQGKKRRQKRDFQKDVLPTLASLSRNEVVEDLQELGTLMRKAGMPWSIQGGVTRRGKPRRNLGVDLEDETDGLIPETPATKTNVFIGSSRPIRRPRSARRN